MKTIRVFPRRTNATPNDENAFISMPPDNIEADEALISVAFSWDKIEAERLGNALSKRMSVKIGGVAYGDPGGEFEPGKFIKQGYVVTSRGCPNSCWFCDVPKREGNIRELQIKEGWNVLDSNLLACSEKHIKAVFEMLSKQKEKPVFTGGLESRLLKEWHVKELKRIKTKSVFFAYDTGDDYEPLRKASKLMFQPGAFTKASKKIRCYVLVGYPNDTPEKAENRIMETIKLGFAPCAMLWRGPDWKDWANFSRKFTRPAIISHFMKGII